MKFYNKYFASNYDELITYYPRFYRDVYEMVEILKAHGGIADELEDNIERTYLNSFIDYADEATIEKLEKSLGIGLNKSRTLEERRRLVKSYFVGFGKVSASMLAEMIESYTGAEVSGRFEECDDEGNNMLYLDLQRGDEPTLYMSDINLLLSKKVPAHIKWQAAVTYRFGIGVGAKRTYYRYGYDLCGTKPEIAMLGAIISRAAVTSAKRTSGKTTHTQTAEADVLTGTTPDIASLASLVAVSSVLEARANKYTLTHENAAETAQEAGRQPITTLLARLNHVESAAGAEETSSVNDYTATGTVPEAASVATTAEINAAAGVKTTDCGVDYIYCGTQYTQS